MPFILHIEVSQILIDAVIAVVVVEEEVITMVPVVVDEALEGTAVDRVTEVRLFKLFFLKSMSVDRLPACYLSYCKMLMIPSRSGLSVLEAAHL